MLIYEFEGECCIIPMFVMVILDGDASIPLFRDRDRNAPLDTFNEDANFKFVLVLLGSSLRFLGFIIS